MNRVILALLLFAGIGRLSAQEANNVIISEICGSGNGVNSLRDFVELYNPTSADIDMSGWTVKYKSATGTVATGSVTVPNGTMIKSHGYFLVGLIGTQAGLVADLEGTFDMSGSTTGGGHIALCMPGTTGPAIWQNQIVVDLIGWGTGNSPEGTAAPSHPSLGGSLERKASSTSTSATMGAGGSDVAKGNGYETNNNAADFVARFASNPQNSNSPTEQPDYLTKFTSNYPNVSSVGGTSFNLNINADRNGKAYFVILPDGASAPTSVQIKNGTDANGTAANIKGTVDLAMANNDYTTAVNGLIANTAYDVYVAAENIHGRIQTSPAKVDAATIGVLPVELLYFTATVLQDRVRLEWTTSKEVNNERFIVERSADAKFYSPIGSVVGGANSLERKIYTIFDRQPVLGRQYYRLRQVDRDGTEKLLADVIADFRITGKQVGIYPNPTLEAFYINLEDRASGPILLEIRDISGKLAHTEKLAPSSAGSVRLIRPSKKLATGQYFVLVKGNGFTEQMKLIVQ
ncbi:lamin tail domain-containing protein [Nubsella zeaxanthinifaciens]|uniref:lamin tail domain-containing protein n=1 Tax=Nubsella zeaxanthinifaciens TaxID=392412 RepID=UPI003D059CEE